MKGDNDMIRQQAHLRGDFAEAHDFYCRCRSCKPPHPSDPKLGSLLALLTALAFLIAAIVVTL
jgi:hypothetical protein